MCVPCRRMIIPRVGGRYFIYARGERRTRKQGSLDYSSRRGRYDNSHTYTHIHTASRSTLPAARAKESERGEELSGRDNGGTSRARLLKNPLCSVVVRAFAGAR